MEVEEDEKDGEKGLWSGVVPGGGARSGEVWQPLLLLLLGLA